MSAAYYAKLQPPDLRKCIRGTQKLLPHGIAEEAIYFILLTIFAR